MRMMSEDKEAWLRAEEEAWMMLSEEDRFRSTAEEGVDPSFTESLPIFRSEITRRLREIESPSIEGEYRNAFSQLDWAEGLEDTTVNFVKHMADDRDLCRRGAAHFAAAKDPALAEALRGKAAWSDVTIAELVEIAASARHLRGTCLRVLAEAEEEDIVGVAAAEYLEHVATHTPHARGGDGEDSIPEYPYRAVADQMHAAMAAGASHPGVKRFVEGFAERKAGRLRLGAAEFGGKDAAKLMEHVATVEALCADTEAFLQKVVASPYCEMWRCFFM
uniref:Uncharacterized protein n=1 Tax=Avena sativa TaxID=4498 RepID=A0ACD6AJA1_AVESA